jgi:hypothetical protein
MNSKSSTHREHSLSQYGHKGGKRIAKFEKKHWDGPSNSVTYDKADLSGLAEYTCDIITAFAPSLNGHSEASLALEARILSEDVPIDKTRKQLEENLASIWKTLGRPVSLVQ